MLEENLKKVSELWKKEGLNLAKPLSPGAVKNAFASLGILISSEVVDVYSKLGGMVDEKSNSVCFSFWTMERVLEENDLNSGLTFFADFLINSHLYGFRFENEAVSSIHIYYGEKDIEKLASSFSEFFEMFLTNPEKLELFERE